MKANDVIQKKQVHQVGEVLGHAFPTKELVINFMEHQWTGEKPMYEVRDDPLNPGSFAPITTSVWEEVFNGRINWAIDKAVSITLDNGHIFITEDFEGEGWVVTQPAPEVALSPQDKANGMSIEELKANIDRLRALRARPSKVKEQRVREVSPSDPLALALASLSPEKLAQIKQKLGIK
jgi:hypothetical protein